MKIKKLKEEKKAMESKKTGGEILGILLILLLFLIVFALPWSVGIVKIFMFLIGIYDG